MSQNVEKVTIFKCFIASPGDTKEEREVCDDVFNNINKTLGEQLGFRIESKKWENDARPAFGKDSLKQIYQSVTEDEALLALDRFSERWDSKYPQISRSWRAHWENLNTLFNYPEDIRKAIYTTNAIESETVTNSV